MYRRAARFSALAIGTTCFLAGTLALSAEKPAPKGGNALVYRLPVGPGTRNPDGILGFLRVDGKLTARKRKVTPGSHTLTLNPTGSILFPTTFQRNGNVASVAYAGKEVRFHLTFEAETDHVYELRTSRSSRAVATLGSGLRPDTALHEASVTLIDTTAGKVVTTSILPVGVTTIIYSDQGESREVVSRIYESSKELLGGTDCEKPGIASWQEKNEAILRLVFACAADGWKVPVLANSNLVSSVLDRR